MTRLLLPLLLIVTSACSQVFYQQELKKNELVLNQEDKKNYCVQDPQEQYTLMSESEHAIQIFHDILPELSPLSFIEKGVLWSLFQMNVSPEQSSPTSRLQIHIVVNKESHYLDFSSKELDAYPFLTALEDVLLTYKSKHTLLSLAKILDKHLPSRISITQSFESFITSNRDELKANPILKKYFFKGDQQIRRNESLVRFQYESLMKSLMPKKKKIEHYDGAKHLFPYKQVGPYNIQCNYDLKLFDHEIYLVRRRIDRGNVFGIQSKNGDLFWGFSSQIISKLTPIQNTYLLAGSSKSGQAAFCELRDAKDSRLHFLSAMGPDPAQLIYHLVSDKYSTFGKIETFEKSLNAPRFLMLQNPRRAVVEVALKNEEQEQKIDYLIAARIPVYHSSDLGLLFAHHRHTESKQAKFVLDKRAKHNLSCLSDSKD